MPLNDVVDQHTNTLIDILERLPSSYRNQIAVTEGIARGRPSFLTEMGVFDNMQSFMMSVRTHESKIDPFLREIFAKLCLREDDVPTVWNESRNPVVARVLTAAYGYHRSLNDTAGVADLKDEIQRSIVMALSTHPQFYILILWALAPEIKVVRG